MLSTCTRHRHASSLFAAAQERTSLAKLVTFSASTVMESDVATMRMLAEGVSPDLRDPNYFEFLSAHGASLSGEGDPLADLENLVARAVVTTGGPVTSAQLPADHVTDLLQRKFIQYECVEVNPERAALARSKGLPVFYGDVARPEIADAFNVGKAKAVIVTIADSRELCTHCPLPETLRSCSAIRIPIAANSPALRSATGMPARTGPWPGKPVTHIKPPIP